MLEASVTGLFRTVLILIGVFTLLRFFGRILVAKRNLASEKEMRRREEENKFEKQKAQKDLGKTNIHLSTDKINASDISFEEVKD